MYALFLIEDSSSEILVRHVMKKLEEKHSGREIYYDMRSFRGIEHLPKVGNVTERKTGQLLNDLPMHLRAFDKKYRAVEGAVIVVVLDNDKREPEKFKQQLLTLAQNNMILTDYVFCIAVKEMEAWLLGDITAIEMAYPNVRKNALKGYVQDGICDTWEILADMVYPGGYKKLWKKANHAYPEIGKMKSEWADRIGEKLDLDRNVSPSFRNFINELTKRIEMA